MNKLLLLVPLILSIGLVPIMADAHQSGCHRWHSCPSDSDNYSCGDIGYSKYCQVLINEVDINPPGDDSTFNNEWVEIYNASSQPIDIRGWEIISTGTGKTQTIPDTPYYWALEPNTKIVLPYQSNWFLDSGDIIELKDKQGNLIDNTPFIDDIYNDNQSWQRVSDGYDTNKNNDWHFVSSTPGDPNK